MDYEGLSLASLLVSFIFSPLLAPLLLFCFFFFSLPPQPVPYPSPPLHPYHNILSRLSLSSPTCGNEIISR